MEVALDEAAASGQYIWVSEGHDMILEPSLTSSQIRYTFNVPKTGGDAGMEGGATAPVWAWDQ
jgi:hypothetical protein